MLQRLIYVSDCVEPNGPSLLNFAEILGVAGRNNRRDHLTGVLLHHDGQFLQVVEGSRVDLDRLLQKLRQDPRHANMRIMQHEAISARLFGNHPMGQCHIGPTARCLIAGRRLDELEAPQAMAVLKASCVMFDMAA